MLYLTGCVFGSQPGGGGDFNFSYPDGLENRPLVKGLGAVS